MERRREEATRNRAILIVRLATLGGLTSALGLTWLFTNLAATYFSGKPSAVQAPPAVPVAALPVQKPRAVVQTVVHHPYRPRAGAPARSGPAPRPPSQGPGPAPPPPPPPACHSTPSHPC
jgi:hypothetical protein